MTKKTKTKEKVEKKKELRPVENFEEDLLSYAYERLKSKSEVEEETTKDALYHAVHILWTFDIRDAMSLILNMESIMDEFEEKFGDRYDTTCDCCKEKLENGELLDGSDEEVE